MKAILLTFDPQLEIANLVVESYNRMWPGCPFTFRIPYTDRDPRTIFRARNVEPVQTARPIRDTMDGLLTGLADEEFVFWCIDDRYPKRIVDLDAVDAVYRAADTGACPADALRLTGLNPAGRAHAVLADDEVLHIGRHVFRRQLGVAQHGFYMPQFARVGLLRRYFLDPSLSPAYPIREFHEFIGRQLLRHRVYVPSEFFMHLGESTVEGRLTSNCQRELLALGLPVPALPTTDRNRDYPR